MQLAGRVLQAPGLTVKDRQNKDVTVQPGNGQFDMRNKKFFRPARINTWGVIVFETEAGDGRRSYGFPRAEAQNAIGALVRACQDVGMSMPPTPPIIYVGNSNDINAAFMQLLEQLNRKVPELIVCMVSEQSSHYYGNIKA
jgi:eukaryotic translation initiation factor 2C